MTYDIKNLYRGIPTMYNTQDLTIVSEYDWTISHDMYQQPYDIQNNMCTYAWVHKIQVQVVEEKQDNLIVIA